MNPGIIIPLIYQLLTAYQPRTNSQMSIAIPTPISPALSAEVTTKADTVPTFTPRNIGGIGKSISIAIIGDSMIEILKPDLPTLKNSLNQYFPDYPFVFYNLGYPSQNIEYAQKKLQEDLFSKNPDIIIIESFAYNNFGNTQENINRHWLDLGAMTTSIKKELPNAKIIIAATIAPNSITFCNSCQEKFSSLEKIEKTKTIKLYIQNAINFANSQGFPLANAYQYTLSSSNEGLPEFISDDSIHPSELGAQLFSDVIAKTIFDNNLL